MNSLQGLAGLDVLLNMAATVVYTPDIYAKNIVHLCQIDKPILPGGRGLELPNAIKANPGYPEVPYSWRNSLRKQDALSFELLSSVYDYRR